MKTCKYVFIFITNEVISGTVLLSESYAVAKCFGLSSGICHFVIGERITKECEKILICAGSEKILFL